MADTIASVVVQLDAEIGDTLGQLKETAADWR
jgi:hypothetical protein